MKNSYLSICVAFSAAALPAHAELTDDRSLYELAPKGSAYVRVVNTTSMSVTYDLADRTLIAEADCGVSPVTWIAPGKELEGNFTTEPGHLYTLTLSGDDRSWSVRKTETDSLRATLSLVNLSEAPVSLLTTEGARVVFPDVAPGSDVQRDLNPLTASLSIKLNSQVIPMTPVSLRRGQVTETFVCGSADQLRYSVVTRT